MWRRLIRRWSSPVAQRARSLRMLAPAAAEILEPRALLSPTSPTELAPPANAVNAAPVIGGLGGTSVYVAGSPAVILSPTATVTDADSANFSGGRLTVRVISGGDAYDRLAIVHQGTAAGQIGVNGSTVTFGGVPVATFSGGSGATPLTINLNTSSATPAAVQALLRRIAFRSASGTPPLAERRLGVQVTDGDGGTSSPALKYVQLLPANRDPVLGNLGAITAYTIGSGPTILAKTATVTDANSADFNGGKLTVRITINPNPYDRLQLVHQGTGAGQIGVSGSTVSYGGQPIGTFTIGTGSTALLVNFTSAAATPAAVQALVRRVAYRNASGTPPTLPRTVSFQVTDGDGGASVALTKNITVSPSLAPARIAEPAADFGAVFSVYHDWRNRFER